MSNAPKDGGYAFPTRHYDYDGQHNLVPYDIPGMTLRDYFAAKAPDIPEEFLRIRREIENRKFRRNGACAGLSDARLMAQWKYEFADAMLAEREKGGGA